MGNTAWMIYGAYGYTGRAIAEEAIARGMTPIVAGRNRRAVETLAATLDCPARVFDLQGPALSVAAHLDDVSVVLNCAGPFSATAQIMMEACILAGVHYLDITGEIDVIEAAATLSEHAAAADVCLIPAVGFDVVPSDCLAAMLVQRLPEATELQLAFSAIMRVSRGTARTMLEGLPRGGRVRRDGQIVKVPLAWKEREIPFRGGTQAAVTIPWGDVASAWYSTSIPNIEVYMAMPKQQIRWLRRVRGMLRLLGLRPVRAVVGRGLLRWQRGPGDVDRNAARAALWGRVSDAAGHCVEATLDTPSGYALTVVTALACVAKILDRTSSPQQIPAGFATPSQAFGAEFILEMPDTELQWVQNAACP